MPHKVEGMEIREAKLIAQLKASLHICFMKLGNWKYILFVIIIGSCNSSNQNGNSGFVLETGEFLDFYEEEFLAKHENFQLEEWKKQTGKYDSLQYAKAQNAYHGFLGEKKWSEKATLLLKNKNELLPEQIKQLYEIIYAGVPFQEGNSGDWLKINQINNSEFRKNEFIKFNKSYFSTKSFDSLFINATSESAKQFWWSQNRESLKGKSNDLRMLQKARNELARVAGFGNYFTYASAKYGLSAQEILQLNRNFLLEIRPVFKELHTFIRHELAEKYDEPIPNKLPNYWLSSFAGDDWSIKKHSKYAEFLNDTIRQNDIVWLQKQIQENFEKLGFEPIPARNLSYETKNATISSMQINRQEDLRLNKTIRKNLSSFRKIAFESMKWHYANNFSNPDVPVLLREPACPALEIAFSKFAENRNLNTFEANYKARLDSVELANYESVKLLEEALRVLPEMIYQSGILSQFEYKLYANELDFEQYNYKWWELQEKFLGISTPEATSSEFADMAVNESIYRKPFSSFDSFLGTIMAYDLERKMENNYSHLTLQRIMRFGKMFTWQELYEENLQTLPNSKTIAEHFKPLIPYLKKLNENRRSTLPEWE